MLFNRRLGFSGTPNNLMPSDLGPCLYEPGSDGLIVHTLTNPNITSASHKQGSWTAHSLLRDIAQRPVPCHALIDTGALITGLDNEGPTPGSNTFVPSYPGSNTLVPLYPGSTTLVLRL